MIVLQKVRTFTSSNGIQAILRALNILASSFNSKLSGTFVRCNMAKMTDKLHKSRDFFLNRAHNIEKLTCLIFATLHY